MSLIEELDSIPQQSEFDSAPEVGDDYQEPTGPAPVPEGNYRLRVEGFRLDKDKDGNPNLTDGVWPVALVEKFVVVEGPQGTEGRVAATYERIYSKPFERNGVQNGASGLGDFARAVDASITFRDPRDGMRKIAEALEGGATVQARVAWEGYDADKFDELVAAQGGQSMCTKEQLKSFRKEATKRGMKQFPVKPDGTYRHVYEGASGQMIEGRARIPFNGYYASNKVVKIG